MARSSGGHLADPLPGPALCSAVGSLSGDSVYDTPMTSDDPTAAALHRLTQAMDLANDLIGGLLRKVEEGQRPTLRVLSGSGDATVAPAPRTRPGPGVLRVLRGGDIETTVRP